MTTFSTKALLIAGGLTSVGVASAGAIYLTTSNKDKSDKQVSDSSAGKAEKQTRDTETQTTPKKISELLGTKRLKLLTKDLGDNSKWEAQWNKFKEAYKDNDPDTLWGFQDWKQIKDESNTINTFKSQCEKLSQLTAPNTDSDATYLEVSKYCTKGINE
ncbi:hypothetical protein A6V39_03360 [Candidatus Mycoplasma haematobovis]|uniref:Variable surface lipoprotein n=1 Tax=Candidatus Mycoplasma haematobovis TaxID=432608 RepID=A0A1A9QBT9_9MOLU|nr:hypothetical protein [Candidatus Mycoplasma haematobovis]OAL09923.1 hypothetical protein A6V39_03360 [Candidatus Mycoplasma haematobovis]